MVTESTSTVFADDGAGARELGVSSKAFSNPISCSSSSWGSTVISSIRLSSSGSAVAGWAHGVSLSGGWVQAVKQEWRARRISPLRSGRSVVHADGRGVRLEFDDDAVDAAEVLGAGRWLKRTRSPTLSIASALAELTVSSSSWRA